jgi:branched-subunit amino acid aminotransferase/4-amino-4-deoxychorismate lyase
LNATVFVNGQISDAEHARIAVFDHGFLYGEGVYETLRTYHGEPFLHERHAARLRQSAGLMALPVPFTDAELLGSMRAAIPRIRWLTERIALLTWCRNLSRPAARRRRR